MKQVNKILVATDLSDLSMQAVDAGATMAERFGAELHLIYVLEDPFPPYGIEYMPNQLDEIRETHNERAAERLGEAADDLKKRGIKVSYKVVNGIPHSEIVELAENEKFDMICLATHGRGFVSRAILGSTTERVLRQAPCPVLAVRDLS